MKQLTLRLIRAAMVERIIDSLTTDEPAELIASIGIAIGYLASQRPSGPAFTTRSAQP